MKKTTITIRIRGDIPTLKAKLAVYERRVRLIKRTLKKKEREQ